MVDRDRDRDRSKRQRNDSSLQGLAGVISKIRLENFMCHGNSEVEFGDHINFITGQNGSGKSAILAALCVAFGCRAKGTQRASSLKDFIKTGCSHASIYVEIKNQGVDAFKRDIYGNTIVIERRISELTSSTILKDHQGRKVGTRRDDILEIINHFNIDIENPCVIMTQDKSREFLSSGNDKDKFKFFFQATLLQKVNDLLLGIKEHLQSANELILRLEESISPTLKELNELESKIRSLESIEEISQKVQQLKKELAWSWVYDVDKKLEEHKIMMEKLNGRIPTCQSKIDVQVKKLDELREILAEKRGQISEMVDKTTDVRIRKDELENMLTLATKERLELEGEHRRQGTIIERLAKKFASLEEHVHEIEDQSLKNTQFEENEMMEKMKDLQDLVDSANEMLARSKDCERSISDMLSMKTNEIQNIRNEIEEKEKTYRSLCSSIHEVQQNQINKVTAFGGQKVITLLHSIERNHAKFQKPPVGPIGVHVTLVNGDMWACAVESAVGKLLNAFIVTDHKDSLILRKCAREVNYSHLQIIIYDFSRPKLNIPSHMLPQTSHPTTFSVLSSDNPTVLNVLIDMGNAERQVLVQDYTIGKNVAFGQKISNLKEVYTSDGYRMFSRGSVETTLPPNKRARTGRLCKSFGDRIKVLETDASNTKEILERRRSSKRIADDELQALRSKLYDEKIKCEILERDIISKNLAMQDVKKSYDAVTSPVAPSEVNEILLEISNIKEEIERKESLLSTIKLKIVENEEKAREVKSSLDNICEFAKEGLQSFEEAESELMQIEENIRTADMERIHYENVMKNKVLVDVTEANEKYEEMKQCRETSCEKASIICPETEVENHIGGSPEKLSGQLNKLQQKLRHESEKCSDTLDDLRMIHEKKQLKILRKQQIYKDFRDKLTACEKALDGRQRKFQRNAMLLRRHLTWQFNGHLKKKGISGVVQVNFQNKTLSIEVKMPQDSSSGVVRDTRGLSGGERSFSTLCFALALHEMTEGPFRAMDEFDVFMDAVSRKISLDTLIDFALEKGSQWIFITPHDISMTRDDERIKKQQLAAPRS